MSCTLTSCASTGRRYVAGDVFEGDYVLALKIGVHGKVCAKRLHWAVLFYTRDSTYSVIRNSKLLEAEKMLTMGYRIESMEYSRFAQICVPNSLTSLPQRVLKKFKGDLKLWLQYIEFAETSRHRISLSRIFGQALAIHPSATSM